MIADAAKVVITLFYSGMWHSFEVIDVGLLSFTHRLTNLHFALLSDFRKQPYFR